MRLRSVVAAPAGAEISSELLESNADAVLVTLADASVAVETARSEAAKAITRIAEAGKAALVQVNHPRTRLLPDDLASIVTPGLAGIFIAHCDKPQDVRDAAVILRELELRKEIEPGTITVFGVIDTARGLLKAAEIVDAAPRASGLVFDGEAYARDTGARPEENGPRFAYARGAIVAAARAFDKVPLVISSGLEMRFLAQHGFAGVVIDDARLAGTANAAFTPSLSARRRAEHQREAYAKARAEGAWVSRIGTEIADAHSARKAEQTLELTDP